MNNLKKQDAVWNIWKFGILFLFGLVVGILFVNITYSYRSSEADVFGMFFLEQLQKNRTPSNDYFLYLLQYRGRFWVTAVALGMTNYAKVCIWLCMIISGFLAGSLSSSILLQQGIKAMVFLLLANLPQVVFYIIGALLLFMTIYQREGNLFKKGIESVKAYGQATIWSIAFVLAGIFLEAYINPYFLRLLTKCLQI